MERVITSLVNCHSEITAFVLRVFVGFVNIGCVVVDFANRQGSELLAVVVPRHEENTVVFVGVESDSCFLSWVDVVPVGIKI